MHAYAPLAQASFRARAAHSAVGEGQVSALPGLTVSSGEDRHTHITVKQEPTVGMEGLPGLGV